MVNLAAANGPTTSTSSTPPAISPAGSSNETPAAADTPEAAVTPSASDVPSTGIYVHKFE